MFADNVQEHHVERYMANHADLSDRAGMTFAVSNVLATVPGILTGPLTAQLLATTGWSAVRGLGTKRWSLAFGERGCPKV